MRMNASSRSTTTAAFGIGNKKREKKKMILVGRNLTVTTVNEIKVSSPLC
jgi:hypothetical protein